MSRSLLLALLLAVLAAACAMLTWHFSHGVLIAWHVPAAILTYLAFIVCVVFNVGRAFGRQWPLSYPMRACDHGLLFAAITMITGMIWGREAWGKAWLWEPRLTGMFLMTLIFLSWRLTSRYIADNVIASRSATSALIILGLPAIAFTHLATRIFGGIHPAQMPKTGSEALVSPLAFLCAAFCYVAFAWALSFAKHALAKKNAKDAPDTK